MIPLQAWTTFVGSGSSAGSNAAWAKCSQVVLSWYPACDMPSHLGCRLKPILVHQGIQLRLLDRLTWSAYASGTDKSTTLEPAHPRTCAPFLKPTLQHTNHYTNLNLKIKYKWFYKTKLNTLGNPFQLIYSIINLILGYFSLFLLLRYPNIRYIGKHNIKIKNNLYSVFFILYNI